jgi:hypothetical protein
MQIKTPIIYYFPPLKQLGQGPRFNPSTIQKHTNKIKGNKKEKKAVDPPTGHVYVQIK